jgi:hypothetical protein
VLQVVITDFGLAKVKTTTKTIAPGAGGVSACYCAPELLNAVTVRRTTACDVYSYGMILYEIATREMPFEGLDIHLIYAHVRQGTGGAAGAQGGPVSRRSAPVADVAIGCSAGCGGGGAHRWQLLQWHIVCSA